MDPRGFGGRDVGGDWLHRRGRDAIQAHSSGIGDRTSSTRTRTGERRTRRRLAPKPTAAPTPEPISEPDDVEPHQTAKTESPDGESTATVATIKPPEIQAAPGFFIPEGQAPRLPGLVLWLDASQLPPTSDPIARWTNSGGGDFVTQQKQASRRPEILAEALQGKAVARFRGAQCLEVSGTSQAMDLGSDYTIAYVARGVAGTLLSKGAGGKAGQFSLLSDSCFLTNGEVNLQSNGRLAAAADDPTQFRVRTIAADASGLNWFVDGTASGSYADDRHEIQNERTLRIGSAWFRSGQEDAAGFFVGDLAELLIYSRALPEDERQRVEAYLREKWLSGDTPPAPLDLVAPTPASPPAEDVAGQPRGHCRGGNSSGIRRGAGGRIPAGRDGPDPARSLA